MLYSSSKVNCGSQTASSSLRKDNDSGSRSNQGICEFGSKIVSHLLRCCFRISKFPTAPEANKGHRTGKLPEKPEIRKASLKSASRGNSHLSQSGDLRSNLLHALGRNAK